MLPQTLNIPAINPAYFTALFVFSATDSEKYKYSYDPT
jgi:hypothetical protein